MIIRSQRPHRYAVIPNAALEDHELSYKARGILAYLLAKPSNWSTSSHQLARSGPDGRDAVRTGLAELRQAGYLVTERRQDWQGRWSTVTMVYDNPQPVDNPVDKVVRNAVDNHSTEAGKTDAGKPGPNISTHSTSTHLLQTPVLQECHACAGRGGWNGPDGGECELCHGSKTVPA